MLLYLVVEGTISVHLNNIHLHMQGGGNTPRNAFFIFRQEEKFIASLKHAS
jgi:hypothetical protein